MDVSRAIFGLALMQLLFTACRYPAAPIGEQATGAAAIGPVPYVMATDVMATNLTTTNVTTTTQPLIARDQPPSEAELLALGATIYATNCAPCHQPNGEGNLEIFPPLNRSAFVTLAAPEPVINTVLHGRALMPAFAPTLDDVEVAAVISYIRNGWDNHASFVNADQVGELRTSASEE